MALFRGDQEEEQSNESVEQILLSILTAINAGSESGDTSLLNKEATQLLVKACLDNIKLDTEKLDVDLSTRASETTLTLLKTATDAIKLSTDNLDVALSTRATEATLEAIRVLMASLDSEDFATETTLAAAKVVLDNIKLDTANLDVALSTVSTEATLALAKTVLDNIKLDTAKLDVNLSTVATQATLEAVRVLLVSLDGKDYATETTLALIKPVLDNIKLDTAKLDVNLSTRASETTLALVEAITSQMTFTGGDLNVNASVSLPAGLSTEAKQDAQIVLETAANALLTSLDGKDYATQTTLEAVRVLIASLDAKDYATETTLAAIKAQTDLLNFTGAKLRTTGEDASGGGGVSVFGDTGGYSNLTPDGTNQLVLAADTDFKEVILYHENKKQGWVKFGGGAAVVGEGFPIKKKQPWILDRCRGEIRIIFESGYDAKDLQINTVKL